jgi:ribose transport system ATP-binding protein
MVSAILQMVGIDKSFGATRALSGMTLDVYPGEIHALMGENGAGKSTLMKILSGVYTPDAGEIRIDGAPVRLHDPASSRAAGINLIYQELAVAPNLSVAENVFMGSEPRSRFGFVDRAQMRRRTKDVLKQLGAGFHAADRAGRLSIAEQQQVEIARALIHRGRVLIMDEPTAALSDRETEHLFSVIRGLRDEGLAIIYISHRMAEVHALADRITVLRDGTYVGELSREELDSKRLVQMMVGRPLDDFYQHKRAASAAGKAALEVENLSGGKIAPASFSVAHGEVLGLAGLVGAGRTELARLLFGADPKRSGTIRLGGKVIETPNPRAAMAHGIGYVPEDRKALGLFLQLSVQDNATLNVASQHSRLGMVDRGALRKLANQSIRQLNVKVARADVTVDRLSGGNQQKVLLARWLEIKPRILILDEPTRGVDIGAKGEIYHIIHALAESGVGVIVISSELPEVVGICDRVLVMREGAITGELAGADITQENIMRLATDTDSIEATHGSASEDQVNHG